MASDIIGIEKVQDLIRKSGRDSYAITRPSQTLLQPPVWSYEGNSSSDAAENFGAWAALSDSNNINRYDIHLMMKGDNDEPLPAETEKAKKEKAKKFRSKLIFTFQLYDQPGRSPSQLIQAPVISAPAPQPREIAAPAPPPDLSGYMRREDVEHLLEKVQTNHQIQQLSAEIARLSRLQEEREYEDEFDEEDEEEEEEIDKIERVGATVRGVIKDIKDLALEKKGETNITGNVDKSLQVAGSEQDFLMNGGDGEEETEELELEEEQEPQPKKYENGKMPAYLKTPVHEDQQAKINAALAVLYKADGHLGDDLMKLAKMAHEKPKKFNGFILTFRED